MRSQEKHAKRDKLFLSLERELSRLQQAQWSAPIIPLEHPYQRGWVKTFALDRGVLRHPDVAAFATVLAKVNQQILARSPRFTNRRGVPLVLQPRIIPPREWARLAWPVSHRRLFVYGNWRVEHCHAWSSESRHDYVPGFNLFSTWWLEEIVQPNIITHRRVDLPEVRSRIAEIEAYLEVHLGWQRLRRLHGRRWRWNGGPESVVEQRALTSFSDQLD